MCMYVYVCVCMCVYVYVCVCICVCMYMRVYCKSGNFHVKIFVCYIFISIYFRGSMVPQEYFNMNILHEHLLPLHC